MAEVKNEYSLSENDEFLIVAYSAMIEEDSDEDEIWDHYLHDD